jgi:very-short-patch-repair endonuclease
VPQKKTVLLERAKAMRSEPTPAEARLWYYLRAKRFEGVKFIRQNANGLAVVDFVARSRKLIIEVDGDTHGSDEATARDAERTARLEKQGYHVIRFTNADVMGNVEAVLAAIGDALVARPLSPTSIGRTAPRAVQAMPGAWPTRCSPFREREK